MSAAHRGDAGGSRRPEPARPDPGDDRRLVSRRDVDDGAAMLAGRLPARIRVDPRDELADMLPTVARRNRRMTRALAGTEAELTFEERVAANLRAAEVLPVTVQPDRFISAESSVYTIGSCFAVNVRKVLREQGLDVHPRSDELELDPVHQHIGSNRALNHYDTFAIRQEIERVLDPAAVPYEPVASRPTSSDGWSPPGDTCWQDPTRMKVFASDEDHLADLTARIDATTRTALDVADVVVISLGLIEAWVDTATGRPVWGHGVANSALDGDRFRFHLSSFEENVENVRWVCRALAEHRPGCPVVLTVSPVGLGRTFTGRDIVVANSFSKSMLRTVAGTVEQEMDHVRYWPSYEIAVRGNLFDTDLRHVTDEGVAFIIERFLEAHSTL